VSTEPPPEPSSTAERLAHVPPPSGTRIALVLIAITVGVCLVCVLGTLGYGWMLDWKFRH
jgi:hypothetical protein